ncbi:MAG: hypothetical protein GF317_01640 [Candidatus Lokiarchaeota archaeon]|nr:hypothetical protein [Candidatus Lokiarchaeota archaeon]MBD3198647.1 hypothetical protein [Candidatus Lokiarchaeota archaeon]
MSESQEISMNDRTNKMSRLKTILFSILLFVSVLLFFWLATISGSILISLLFVSFFFLAFLGLLLKKKETSLSSKLFPSLYSRSNKKKERKNIYDKDFFEYSHKALKFKYKKPLLSKCPDCGFLVTGSTTKCPNCRKNLMS